jgi:hypothetical protein
MERDPPWRPEFRGKHSVYLTETRLELHDIYGTDKLLAKAKSDLMIRLRLRTHKIEVRDIGVQKIAACAISK